MSRNWMFPSHHDTACATRKPSSLSSTILDYYNRYGQNRDLEKYLRFRRCGRSSSDESGSVHYGVEPAEGTTSKSLENLHVLHANLDLEKKAYKSRSSESLRKENAKCTPRNDGTQSARQATVGAHERPDIENTESNTKTDEVKVQIKNAHKSKSKKSWNWNMESNIEITFPQAVALPTNHQLYTPFIAEAAQPGKEKLALEHSGTQTSAQTRNQVQEFPKTPIRPLEKQTRFECAPPPQERPISAASSVASVSNKQRLEWDSMADVGYDRSSEPSHSRSLDSMTSFERSTLQKFFAERGLSFDSKIMVIGSKQPPTTKSNRAVTTKSTETQTCSGTEQTHKQSKDKWENAFRKILDEKHKQMVTRNASDSSSNGKRLWESALKKFRSKYGNRINESDLCITKPEIHSTPNVEPVPVKKGAITKSVDFQKPPTASVDENKFGQISQEEKSCQTSVVSLATKECQVEAIVNVSRGTSVKSESSNQEIADDSATKKDLDSAASFEFLSASAYEKGLPIRSYQRSQEMEDKENISCTDNKENIPPQIHEEKSSIEPDNVNVLSPKFSRHSNASIDESVHQIVKSILSSTGTDTVELNSSTPSSFYGTLTHMEADIRKGVDLLNSLVESNRLDKPTKKRMIKQIVRRLLKAKYSDSTRSSSEPEMTQRLKINISGVTTLSSTANSIAVPVATNQNAKDATVNVVTEASIQSATSTDEYNNTMKDWLQPMTHSELNYDQRTKAAIRNDQCQTTQNADIEKKQLLLQNRLINAQNRLTSNRHPSKSPDELVALDDNMLKFVSNERSSQLDWIEKEINHLVNLKEFLIGEKKKREMDIMKGIVNLHGKKMSTEQMSLSAERKESSDRGVDEKAVYANVQERNVSGSSRSGYIESMSSKEATGHSSSSSSKNSRALQDLASISARHSAPQTARSLKHAKEKRNENHEKDSDSQTDWNSHVNMQKIDRNRTKLETPTNKHIDTDIVAYARAKQQDFIEKYQTTGRRMYHDRMLYTQPYSSDHYSEPHEARRKIIVPKKSTTDAYTSITTSDLFLSSNSVSLPGAETSTSNTTTHQYDSHHSVAVQTTGSLLKISPIFGKRKMSSTSHTQIVTKNMHNKQQQAVPASISYTITFDKKPEPAVPKQSPTNEQIDLSYPPVDRKRTLNEHLCQSRPKFMSKAEARRLCLHEIANLRQRRNEQRQQLFLLSSNTSLPKNMKYLNPPPITMQRVFTTKGLKQATRQRYRNLPEVRQKEETERQNKIKRSNRIVTDMFNRNLQRRVLKGDINLSNSVSVT